VSAVLSVTVIAYALGVACVCAFSALSGRRRPRAVLVALLIVQSGVVVQAVLDGLALGRGVGGDEVAINVGYLITSLVILPVTAVSVRMDEGRWGSVALAVGLVLVAVVSLRLHQTLDAARG
jgi:hypothetical protein